MSNGFHLVPAHSVITLAEELAAQIARRENPLLPETVLVMNYAQQVWLRRFLAEKLGICANLNFVSPEAFLQKLVAGEADAAIFERNTLAWRIFETLKKLRAPGAGTPPPLRFELESDTEENLFLLAVKLGDLFWRYQSFRPQMIRDWTLDAPAPSTSDTEFLREYARQKNLWRALGLAAATPPAVAWINLLKSPLPPEKTPPRIFAFAPSALPRIHVELLEKLAETSDVFLYYHHLSHDLWTESAEAKKRLRERLRGNGNTENAESDSLFSDATAGNELLAAWGKAARPLAAHLIDAGLLDADASRDLPPPRDSLLHALQREIRDNSPEPAPFVPAADDRSLKISVAPGPVREMEILRDELIARFAQNPELAPSDVLVMFPDIAEYAPFIRAAFENSGLPFSIADRAGTEIFPVASAFLEILRVAAGEFRLDEILALLDRESITAALGSDEAEISALRPVLAAAGIRWGADTAFRRNLIFGETEAAESVRAATETFAENNSWEFGLRRLALGYMCGNTDEILSFGENLETLPVPELTEAAPAALGKIVRLLRLLQELNRAFSEKETRSVPAWCDYLKTRIADGFFDLGDGSAEILRSALAALKEASENGNAPGVPAECTLATLCLALNQCDWSPKRPAGMLRGKITFCQMQPMRNIPAKIICIAGLNDGAFPRASERDALDLLSFPAKNFPPSATLWDRTRRDDDCLLFLESLLAARETLLLSYVGRNAKDGQELPPCVPLAKLRDFLLQIVSGETDTPGKTFFETRHRLHGFSPEYFSENTREHAGFFSFSRADYATLCGAKSAAEKTDEARGDLGGDNAPKFTFPHVPAEISANSLASFFKSPAKFICRNLLGISRKYGVPAAESGDPPAKSSELDAARFFRLFFERTLAEKSQVPAAVPATEPAAKMFHARELAAGNISALTEKQGFDADFFKTRKGFNALAEILPCCLTRVPEDEIPVAVAADPARLPAALPSLRVTLNFENLFRDPDGNLVLALGGQKIFDWRSAVDAFVAAQMLSAAFPQKLFRVFYFAYASDKPQLITDASLAACGISAQDLLAFFAEKISSPPLFFEKLPLVIPDGTGAEDFLSQTRTAWDKETRDATELFLFGENAAARFEENLREVVFPFVAAVCRAFVPACA